MASSSSNDDRNSPKFSIFRIHVKVATSSQNDSLPDTVPASLSNCISNAHKWVSEARNNQNSDRRAGVQRATLLVTENLDGRSHNPFRREVPTAPVLNVRAGNCSLAQVSLSVMLEVQIMRAESLVRDVISRHVCGIAQEEQVKSALDMLRDTITEEASKEWIQSQKKGANASVSVVRPREATRASNRTQDSVIPVTSSRGILPTARGKIQHVGLEDVQIETQNTEVTQHRQFATSEREGNTDVRSALEMNTAESPISHIMTHLPSITTSVPGIDGENGLDEGQGTTANVQMQTVSDFLPTNEQIVKTENEEASHIDIDVVDLITPPRVVEEPDYDFNGPVRVRLGHSGGQLTMKRTRVNRRESYRLA